MQLVHSLLRKTRETLHLLGRTACHQELNSTSYGSKMLLKITASIYSRSVVSQQLAPPSFCPRVLRLGASSWPPFWNGTHPILWSSLLFAPTSDPPSAWLAPAVILGLPAALWAYKVVNSKHSDVV